MQVLEELYGVKAKTADFVPFAGTGEANFLGGVARKYGAKIDIAATKERFFEVYLKTASSPDYKIGYPGKLQSRIQDCGHQKFDLNNTSPCRLLYFPSYFISSILHPAGNFYKT